MNEEFITMHGHLKVKFQVSAAWRILD